jgi:hypothetical protein
MTDSAMCVQFQCVCGLVRVEAWTYAGLLAVEDGVADGGVGIALAPLHARGDARRARRRDPRPGRR